jgi:hypothetical protein
VLIVHSDILIALYPKELRSKVLRKRFGDDWRNRISDLFVFIVKRPDEDTLLGKTLEQRRLSDRESSVLFRMSETPAGGRPASRCYCDCRPIPP